MLPKYITSPNSYLQLLLREIFNSGDISALYLMSEITLCLWCIVLGVPLIFHTAEQ